MPNWLITVGILMVAGTAVANDLELIGVTHLRQVAPSLNGSGVKVAQVEAEDYSTLYSDFPFEVNPTLIGQPTNLLLWASISNKAATTFPNTAGTESDHADSVAGNFYGNAGPIYLGVATNVAKVYNYEANYFIQTFIATNTGPVIPARVVNQSYTYATNDDLADQAFDNYSVRNQYCNRVGRRLQWSAHLLSGHGV